MPESERQLKNLSFKRNYTRLLQQGLENIYKGAQNFPESAFRNFLQLPAEGIGSAVGLAISNPVLTSKLGYGFTPPGIAQDLIAKGISKDEYSSGAYPFLLDALKGLFNQKKDYYANPENFVYDPAAVASDALQLTLPLFKPAAGSSAFKNYVLRNIGTPAKSQPASNLFTTGNTATLYNALEKAFQQKVPFSPIQTVTPKPSSLLGSIDALEASKYDPNLGIKIIEQKNALDRWADTELLGGRLGASIGQEPGQVAKNLNVLGVSNRQAIRDAQKAAKGALFQEADQFVENGFRFEEQKYKDAVEAFNKSKAKNKVKPDINDFIGVIPISAPIQLNSTYNTIREYQAVLNRLQKSVIGKNPQLFAQYKNVIPQLRAFTSNPTESYAPEVKQFIQNIFGSAPRERLADLYTLDKTIKGLAQIAGKLDEGSDGKVALAKLADSLRADINYGLNKLRPGLGDEWKNWKALASEQLRPFSTNVGRALGKEHSKGLTFAELNQSPLAGYKAALGDTTKFKNLIDIVGKDAASESLVYSVLDESRNAFGYDFKTLANSINRHRGKFEILGPGNSKLKHGLGTFANAIEMQNRLPVEELNGQAMRVGSNRAILNIGAGLAVGRPGLVGFGATKMSEILFEQHSLAKILSEPNAAYQAARLMKTPITSLDYPGRIKTFMRVLGKLGLTAELKNADGSTAKVVIDPIDGPVPEGESIEVKW